MKQTGGASRVLSPVTPAAISSSCIEWLEKPQTSSFEQGMTRTLKTHWLQLYQSTLMPVGQIWCWCHLISHWNSTLWFIFCPRSLELCITAKPELGIDKFVLHVQVQFLSYILHYSAYNWKLTDWTLLSLVGLILIFVNEHTLEIFQCWIDANVVAKLQHLGKRHGKLCNASLSTKAALWSGIPQITVHHLPKMAITTDCWK